MSQFFVIHPENPQARLIAHTVEILRKGGVIAYPTDSAYALGCIMGDKRGIDTIRRIRQIDEKHNLTLVCRDLSDLSSYANVDNVAYRLIKNNTPGPYTFILQATREVPRRLLHPKRRTIGLRVLGNPIASAILAALGEPMLSTSLIMPNDEQPLSDPDDIRDRLEHELDLVIDGGFCGVEESTIINLLDGAPEVVRVGMGDPSPFQ
ncbi:MAG: L-threonylcarbamoyladenylate synthase [Reinekea forsetii]|jgi:tRNA threonylcarbamoyl adenosine modification protein (Sua5/YciO/YrdC/YwlC family)|uniref:Translation factor Sua5 n=1 Tax=Reinekea forsetii TaxID=1336806 RepID=A0A2K8KSG2_9GAMM|nr:MULTISPECIES: L-threonylcarbamoyladenylate synthase [Reinekea]ATX77658.1 translation factor Sua5 [Reinekea forsetii]MDO7640341.1 L-threonylcarbamoyladenylate synthase [Reinekea forsetii]MDO7645478.1 L-threonylcarbamoyladenylate synthase [Reinekea forsetii]MDO7673542.1 L-threonylcarbamoyladenylate synthase [Reinekea forsetii]